LQQSIETQAKLLGFNIQYRLRLPNFGAIAEVVAKGVGIAIMPAVLHSAYNRTMISIPFNY
jgi:DNA-binding transcriptional LysR family regulator